MPDKAGRSIGQSRIPRGASSHEQGGQSGRIITANGTRGCLQVPIGGKDEKLSSLGKGLRLVPMRGLGSQGIKTHRRHVSADESTITNKETVQQTSRSRHVSIEAPRLRSMTDGQNPARHEQRWKPEWKSSLRALMIKARSWKPTYDRGQRRAPWQQENEEDPLEQK
ncbi:hypothetical protein R1flu_019334 [Riccia fluitans]|uniref:Uncharacterized protein n=1 Tax=Riccia fluitans TaxID=41844 RepID=A0ABD1ZJX2_9MARC